MSAGRWWRSTVAVLLALGLVVGFAEVTLAQSPRGDEAREIAGALVCPVCQGRAVADSPAPLAQQMRELIQKKLDDGESREGILQYFVDRYGEGILREPPRRGFNQVLWWLPLLGLVVGVGVLARVLYGWTAGRSALASAEMSELAGMSEEDLSRYERQLEQDLGGRPWATSRRTESASKSADEGLAEMPSPTRRSPGSETAVRKAPSSSSRGKGPLSERRTGARPGAVNGAATARPTARSGASRHRGWIPAAVFAAGLVLVTAFATWPYLNPSGPQPIATLGTEDVHALAISPRDGNVIFFGHHDGVLRSDDGGRNWRPLVARSNFDAMGLAVSASTPEAVYAAGHRIFFQSTDGGKSWQPVANDLPYDDIHGFAVDPGDPKALYAFVVGYGLFRSGDGGASWKNVGTTLPDSVMALAVAPDDPRVLYAASMQEGLLRSIDGGATWRPANRGIDAKAAFSLATSPSAPGLVYVGTDQGLFRSGDSGENWTRAGFERMAQAVAVAPTNPRLILVVDDRTNVYRSEDGGATWAPNR